MTTFYDRLDDYQRQASFDSEPPWPDITPAERERTRQLVRELWLADRAFEEVPQ